MKLAYFHYLCDGATGLTHVEQFARAAEALDHQVIVRAMNLAGGTSSPTPRARARLRAAAKKRLGRYLHEPKELLWNLRYVPMETELVRSIRPDVLLVRDHLLTVSCLFVSRRARLPLVLELNAPAAESRMYFDEYWHLPWVPERLQAWKLRRADALTVVSTAMKDHFVERYGIPGEKFTVVPNGADTSAFTPDQPPDEEVRKRLGDRTIVGFLGSFHKFHGPELLADMVVAVAGLRRDVGFLFVGEESGMESLRDRIAGFEDRVVSLGRVPHERVPKLVASFDIGIMAESNFYGSPLKVLEWMAAGKAIVAPRYGPLEELIDDGVEGLLFPPRDVAGMVERILTLVDRPGLARQLGEAAARKVRASLTWTHNAGRVLSACEKAMRAHRPPPPP